MAGDAFVWVGPLSGSWNQSTDWTEDGAATANTPGANDSVDITSSGNLQVVTGDGQSASLTLNGPIELMGTFVTSALTVVEGVGVGIIVGGGPQPPPQEISIVAGANLTVTGDAEGPTPPPPGGITAFVPNAVAFDVSGVGASLVVGGTLAVGGESTFGADDLTLADGGQAKVGSLLMGDGGVTVDAASSLEVGGLGGAALGSVTIDPGAKIMVEGSVNALSAPMIIDNGVIETPLQSGLAITGPVTGSGRLLIDGASSLTVDQVAAGVTIQFGTPANFGGPQGPFPVGGPLTISPASLGPSGGFGAAIVGFVPSDLIDFSGVVTSATWAHDVLTLSDGPTVVAELNLRGDYAGAAFSVMSLGSSGTQISVSAAPLPTLHDFSDHGISDFLIENTSGAVVIGQVANGGASFSAVASLGPEWKIVGNGDFFFGDGKADFLIENTSGAVFAGEVGAGGAAVFTQVGALGPEWSFHGTGDFLGHGLTDFLIENLSGEVAVGESDGPGLTHYTQVAALGSEWRFVGTGDFLNDGHDQFLIGNTAGAVDVADWSGGMIHFNQVAALGPEWKFEGAGDFLGDGKSDFLIENANGAVVVGEVVNGQAAFTQITGLGSEWKFVGTGDFLAEGHDQFLIENTAGAVVIGDWTGGAIHFTQVGGLGPEWFFHT